MTISLAQNAARVSYSVSEGATQTSFTVSFEFFDDADLNVYVDGTLKTITTHYSVSGGNGSTGAVAISVTGATGGSTVVITRNIALARTTDFPTSGSFQIATLNTELDRFTAIAADLKDSADRALILSDSDSSVSTTLPLLASRKGTVLGFNASTGAVEAGPSITAVQSLADVTASINLLGTSAVVEDMGLLSATAVIEDMSLLATAAVVEDMGLLATSAVIEDMGLLATSAVIEDMGLLGTSANVTAMGLLGNSTVITNMSNLSASAVIADMAILGTTDVVADMAILGTSDVVSDMNTLATSDIVSDMNTLATSANVTAMGLLGNSTTVTNMGLLGTSAAVADMALLGTSDVVADMALLATSDVISDMNTLATSDIISDLNTLATSDIVTDMNLLATSSNVAAMALLGTSDVVADMALLGTSDVVADLAILGTSDAVADMNTLATSDIVSDMNTLATSANVTAMGLLGTSAVVEDMGFLGTAAVVEDMGILGTSANVTAMSNVSGSISNVNTVATNLSGITAFSEVYSSGSSDPSSNLNAGDLFFNTSSDTLKVYTGSAWEQGVTAGSGFLPLSGGTMTGNLVAGDNVKATFGAGSDLQIYHDGSNSYIAEGGDGTGSLRLQANNLLAYSNSDEPYFQGVSNGTFRIYYDGSTKLATTATGVDVTGNVIATGTVEPAGDTAAGDNAAIGYTASEGLILTGQGSTSDITLKNDADAVVFTVPTGTDDILFPDNAKAMFGAGSDLQIYHTGSHSYIIDGGSGNLYLQGSSNIRFQNPSNETMMNLADGGAVTLYHNNAVKLTTTATGVDVTGDVVVSGTVDGVDLQTLNTAVTANTAKTTNATHSGEVTGSGALTIADNVVDEANLKVSNSPTNGYVLTAQSGNTGGLTWAAVASGTPAIVFPSNWASPTNNYTSSGTWSKGSLADDDYVWFYLVNSGGGGGNTMPGEGGRAMLLYGTAATFNGAAYTIGAAKAGANTSAATTQNTTTVTLSSGNGSIPFTPAGLTEAADVSGSSVEQSNIRSIDAGVDGTYLIGAPSASYSIKTGTLPSGYGRWTISEAINTYLGEDTDSVFAGGIGFTTAGSANASAVSLFAGNGGASDGAAGAAPGGGGAQKNNAAGGTGAAGSLRVYHV